MPPPRGTPTELLGRGLELRNRIRCTLHSVAVEPLELGFRVMGDVQPPTQHGPGSAGEAEGRFDKF
jgi:hypothetical protein